MLHKILRSSLFAIVLVSLIFFLNFGSTSAEDFNWVSNNDLKFDILRDNLSFNDLPSTSSDYNRDCIKRDLTLRFSQIPYLSSAENINLCSVDTEQGLLADKYFQINGSNKAGQIDTGGNNLSLYAGNNSGSYIVADRAAPTGLYVNYLSHMTIKTKTNFDSSISHTVENYTDITPIKNGQGQKLTMMPSTLSFSSNGKWALFDSSGYGYVRLNLDDGTIVSFGYPTTYNMGFDPSYKTAISSDGRYAIFGTVGSSVIYDLDDCPTNQTSFSYLKNCKYREINNERLSKTSNFGRSMTIIRFTSDKSFTYYTGQRDGDLVVYKQYRVTMGDLPLYGMGYLGLGDSFSSGEGSYNYKPFTDVADNNCHTSLSSYPFVLGSKLNKEKYNSIACSGAVTGDVFLNLTSTFDYKGQFKDSKTQSQLNDSEINAILSSFTPGKITQQTFVSKLTPETITVSVGGNDIGFADKIKSCLYKDTDSTCFNSYEDRAEVLIEINNAIPKIASTLSNLKVNNNRVYALGYPSIISSNGNCANNVKFNNSEADFANKLVDLLNNAVATASRRAGVYYVDVSHILDGHRLCETNSTNVFVNGLTIDSYQRGDKWNWDIAQESFHPKVQAQRLYADAILSQTNNLTKPMPSPDSSASLIVPALSDVYWQVAKTNRSILMPIYLNDMLDNQEYHNRQVSKQISQLETNLQPNSSVILEMHSNPINLGTFTTDSNGNLTINFTIPSDIEPGYHSLHIYGKNTSGEDIDIYDYVFVGSSPEDINGNGIVDTKEGCLFVALSGVDSDKDGIDDNCDGFADPLPVQSSGNILATDPIVSDPPAPLPTNDNAQVTPLPDIEPSPNIKDPGTSNETDAGNEPTVPNNTSTDNQQPTTPTNNVTPTTTTTPTPRRSSRNISLTPPQVDNNVTPSVLSESDQNKVVAPTSSPVVASTANLAKSYKFYQKAWFYYVLIGLLSVVMILIFAIYRRRRSTQN